MKILITGGCGQLGSCVSRKLADEGHQIVVVDSLVGSDHASSESIQYLQADITNITDRKMIFEKNRFDCLINNAGIGVFTDFYERTDSEIESVLAVNGAALISVTRDWMNSIKGDPGVLINIASIYGLLGSDYRIYGNSGRNNSEVYSYSKGGVIAFSKYIAANFERFNVRCNCVSPGGIFNSQMVDFVENYSGKVPMGRMAAVDEVADTIVFLASDQAAYINGQNLIVDGGFSSW